MHVPFSDVDLARVAHHGRYWSWCEEARFHFADNVLGISRHDIAALGVYMPVIWCRCDYASPVRWGDRIEVAVELERLRGARLTFYHEIRNAESNARIATAVTRHAFTDEDLRLRLTVPPLYRERYDAAVVTFPSAFRSPESGSDARR
jgi:acyl-CoA thioester hydrolase